MSSDKAYPTDPAGLDDCADHVAQKPCARRLERSNGPQTWCALPSGHEGNCAGFVVRPIDLDDLGPNASKRRRW